MTLHIGKNNFSCPKCTATYIPFKHDLPCPNCNHINPNSDEYTDFIDLCVMSLRINRKKGSYVPGAWFMTTDSDHIQDILFKMFDLVEKNRPEDIEEYIDSEWSQVQWKSYQKKHLKDIFIAVYVELKKPPQSILKRILLLFRNDPSKMLPEYTGKKKGVSHDQPVHTNNHTFTILGEEFEIKHFPKLYSMHQNSPARLERQLRNTADAWHKGHIVSAAQALESDLGKQ